MHLTATDVFRPVSVKLAAALCVLVVAGVLAAAAPAHADDASYLAKLNASGVPFPMPDDVRLATGHYLCGQLRLHATPQELVSQMVMTFFYSLEAAQVQVDAARTELCPETLR